MNDVIVRAHAREVERDARQYRHIVAVCYPVFLLLALIGRLMPARWRPLGVNAGSRLSVFAEARHAAHTIIPLVFSA